MTVVLDTNVLLSGMLWEGLCGQLLDACIRSDDVVIVTSQYILDEFSQKAKDKFNAPREKIDRAIRFLQQHTELVTPAIVPRNACRDPDDLPVLGTAVAAKADCLVTGDSDLLSLVSYEGINIVSPRQLYQQLVG